LNFALTASWVATRIARRAFYRLTGRSPLVAGHAPSLAEEWAAVSGLVGARSTTSRQADGTWKTPVGLIRAPQGAQPWYVGVMAQEIAANIYGFRSTDRVVIDCGANIGLFTLQALHQGAERVLCFEPSPDTAACLRENTKGDPRVTIIEKGAWDKEETLFFSTASAENPGSHHLSDAGNIQVPVTTIDSVVSGAHLQRLDLIKMDIEGAEIKALLGARETIGKFHPRICVATEHTDDLHANAVAVIQTMQSIDARYRYTCSDSRPEWSPLLQKKVLVPYTISFSVN
jgi:FkbM family methyltransferase